MRVLVTGASGFLGYHLLRHLQRALPTGAEAVGTYHKVLPDLDGIRLIRTDLRGERECSELLADLSPTHVVHTAAMSQTGDCERDPGGAHAANVVATRNLVSACASLANNAYLLFVSTDLVFDGTKGNYSEADEAKPLQVYGATKLEAEQEVAAYSGPWGVLRSALIYGAATPHRRCFLQWMVDGIRSQQGALFADEIRNPVWVEDLSGAIASICQTRTTGLYHCAGGDALSRWDFGAVVADVYGLDLPEHLRSTRAEKGLSDQRPADVTLNIGKLTSDIGYSPTPLRTALEQVRLIEGNT